MLFTIFILLVSHALAIDPPVWPDFFSEKFVESYSYTSIHTSGQLFYDVGKNMLRVDRVDGRFEGLCGNIMPNAATPCVQLVRNDKLYVYYPEKRSCCECCDAAHGCGVTPKDWLKNSTFKGEETIMGQSFYKWTTQKSEIDVFYYARKDAALTPRKISDANIKIIDFIMSTYSPQEPAQSVFELPTYCQSLCPPSTVCGQLRTGKKGIPSGFNDYF